MRAGTPRPGQATGAVEPHRALAAVQDSAHRLHHILSDEVGGARIREARGDVGKGRQQCRRLDVIGHHAPRYAPGGDGSGSSGSLDILGVWSLDEHR